MGVLLIWLVTLLLVLDSSSAAAKSAAAELDECDRCVHQSNVTFFSSNDDGADGTCGYGTRAKILYGGQFAGANPVIYNKGVVCGGCFQLRCKDEENCKEEGTTVIVTNLSNDNFTDFVLSQTAFKSMAKTEAGSNQLMKLGRVDVEHQRVPCEYGKKKNMSIRVEETSIKKKGYLAITLLYQGGQADIASIYMAQAKEIWSEESLVSLARTNNGAVWGTTSSVTKKGPLKFKFNVRTGDSWIWYITKTGLPANWANGVVYDSGIQITVRNATPPETCKTCSNVWT